MTLPLKGCGKAGAESVTFNPTSVSTLLAGFSTRLSSLFQNSNGTTAATAGDDPVGYASDLSGNSRHFTQPDNTGRRPLLKLNQINGFAALRFDGTDDVIYNKDWAQVQPYVLFVVCKQITWTLADRLTSGGDNTDMGVINQFNTASPNLSIYSGSAFTCENANLAVGSWGILEVLYNGASSEFQVNGGTATTGNPGADVLGDGLAVGGKSNAADSMANIDVAEVLVYDNLSAGERTTVRQGLGAVYGITLS